MIAEILIVDDNADIRNILNELIIDAGYKTRVAANYNQALSEIDKKIPDVAILDVKLDKQPLPPDDVGKLSPHQLWRYTLPFVPKLKETQCFDLFLHLIDAALKVRVSPCHFLCAFTCFHRPFSRTTVWLCIHM